MDILEKDSYRKTVFAVFLVLASGLNALAEEKQPAQVLIDSYKLPDKLMAETRRLAAEYYRNTKQSLPVSNELAKYDACRLLNLHLPEKSSSGIDALDADDAPIQIKGRVIFDESKSNYRIGQVNRDGNWQQICLVILDAEYEPYEIYSASRAEIDGALSYSDNPKRAKRGAISLAKFKIIGQLRWTRKDGIEVND